VSWPTGDPDPRHSVGELLRECTTTRNVLDYSGSDSSFWERLDTKGSVRRGRPHFLVAGKHDDVRILAEMTVGWSSRTNPGHSALHGVLPCVLAPPPKNAESTQPLNIQVPPKRRALAAQTFVKDLTSSFASKYPLTSPGSTTPPPDRTPGPNHRRIRCNPELCPRGGPMMTIVVGVRVQARGGILG